MFRGESIPDVASQLMHAYTTPPFLRWCHSSVKRILVSAPLLLLPVVCRFVSETKDPAATFESSRMRIDVTQVSQVELNSMWKKEGRKEGMLS
jgi:hypothetical protein